MANFENISRETKRESFKGDEDRLQADTVKSPAIEIALKQKNLFAKGDDDEVEADVSPMEHVGTFLKDTLRIGRFPAIGSFCGRLPKLYPHTADPSVKKLFLELRWRMCLTQSFGTIKSL